MSSYSSIGIMSGSSKDGLDLVYVHFKDNNDKWSYEIKIAQTISFPEEVLKILSEIDCCSVADYQKYDTQFGYFVGNSVQQFMKLNEIDRVDVIGFHGHTIFHEPKNGYSKQLENGQLIAFLTQQKTVVDFRSKDILYGGQGAPLVPFGEKHLFLEHSIFLNIGGIANISFLNDSNIAYDICGANQLLNYFAQKEEMPFDVDGNLAKTGVPKEPLLKFLSHWYFYKKDYPKSLSNQQVKEIIPQIEQFGYSIADTLNTLVEHITQQVAKEIILHFAKKGETPNGSICVTGGGALNKFLVSKLNEHLPITVHLPNQNIINYKEALIFAYLGLMRLHNVSNCISSVTGASKDVCGGVLYYP